jgi:hypothetical protein
MCGSLLPLSAHPSFFPFFSLTAALNCSSPRRSRWTTS